MKVLLLVLAIVLLGCNRSLEEYEVKHKISKEVFEEIKASIIRDMDCSSHICFPEVVVEHQDRIPEGGIYKAKIYLSDTSFYRDHATQRYVLPYVSVDDSILKVDDDFCVYYILNTEGLENRRYEYSVKIDFPAPRPNKGGIIIERQVDFRIVDR